MSLASQRTRLLFQENEAKQKLFFIQKGLERVREKMQEEASKGPTKEWIDSHGGHWGGHSEYSPIEWQEEVEADETRLGYWEWAFNNVKGFNKEPSSNPCTDPDCICRT